MKSPARVVAATFLVASAIASPLLLSACTEPQAATVTQTPAVPVDVATVITTPVADTKQFSGHLVAVEQVELRTRVNGHITATHFQDGALVHKGDALFQIDPRPFQAALSQAEATLQQAEARAQQARSELKRAEQLVAIEAISKEDLERKQTDLSTSLAAVSAADAQVAKARIDLGFTAVRAPITGRAGKILVTPGNVVMGEGGGTLLTTVVRVDPLYAEFTIDDRTYLDTAAALRTKSRSPDISVEVGRLTLKGRLHFLDNAIDPATGTLQARAIVPNPEGTLAPGLFAQVNLATDATPTLQVRDAAIGTDQDRRFVFVVGPDNKLSYREVELGPLHNGLRVIHRGLQPRERIVVNGLQRVQTGTQVAPHPVAMAVSTASTNLAAQ